MEWIGMGHGLYDDHHPDAAEQGTKRTHESRAVPETMDDNAGLEQWLVTDRILLQGLRETEPTFEYENVRPEPMLLSTLDDMWNRQHATKAIRTLFKKHRLTIDNHYMLPMSGGKVALVATGVSALRQWLQWVPALTKPTYP